MLYLFAFPIESNFYAVAAEIQAYGAKIIFWGHWWSKKSPKLVVIRWASLPQPTIPLPQDNTLGSYLKYLRRCLREPQISIATRIGHPVGLISKYERNKVKKPNPQILLEFAKALKVSPDRLISIQCFQPISKETEIDKLLEFLITTKNFGSELRDLRLRANVQQTALARKIGLNRESIRRYEKNITKPNKEILSQIISVLKESSSELHNKYYHNNPNGSRNLKRRC